LTGVAVYWREFGICTNGYTYFLESAQPPFPPQPPTNTLYQPSGTHLYRSITLLSLPLTYSTRETLVSFGHSVYLNCFEGILALSRFDDGTGDIWKYYQRLIYRLLFLTSHPSKRYRTCARMRRHCIPFLRLVPLFYYGNLIRIVFHFVFFTVL
jgi:hypothetical protein